MERNLGMDRRRKKSVYIDKVNIHEAHCVHCARAEVLIKIYKSD